MISMIAFNMVPFLVLRFLVAMSMPNQNRWFFLVSIDRIFNPKRLFKSERNIPNMIVLMIIFNLILLNFRFNLHPIVLPKCRWLIMIKSWSFGLFRWTIFLILFLLNNPRLFLLIHQLKIFLQSNSSIIGFRWSCWRMRITNWCVCCWCNCLLTIDRKCVDIY